MSEAFSNVPAGWQQKNLWLVGTKCDRDGFGVRTEAVDGDLHQAVENVPQSGYFSQNAPRPHFGLDQHSEVDALTIR